MKDPGLGLDFLLEETAEDLAALVAHESLAVQDRNWRRISLRVGNKSCDKVTVQRLQMTKVPRLSKRVNDDRVYPLVRIR